MKKEPLPKEWEEFGEIPIGFHPIKPRSNPFTRFRELGESAAFYFLQGTMQSTAFTSWSYNIRGQSTDTRPTNITEGAD